MRPLYIDTTDTWYHEIKKVSFYDAAHGFIGATGGSGAFAGYTADSGHTIVKRFITRSNVNYGLYPVNLTFGFGLRGVKAFDQNKIIAYGDYGFEPSIIYSSDGGNTYQLVYWSSYTLSTTNGIKDMVFPENTNIGYAIDDTHILKTTNGGLNWSIISNLPNTIFTNLEAVDNNTVFALSTGSTGNGLMKTLNGGQRWDQVILPPGLLNYASFITSSIGWVDMGQSYGDAFYMTSDGGNTWTQLNDVNINSFNCTKFKFTSASTGYAIVNDNVFKTTDAGRFWELVPKEKKFDNWGTSFNDIQCLSSTQLWAGGVNNILAISANGGGSTMPNAYFKVDTSGLYINGNVNLVNYSKQGYTYRWEVNNTLVGTGYNASYIHNQDVLTDTIRLIVSNGTYTDNIVHYQDFYPRVRINSFVPVKAASMDTVAILGANLSGATAVSFGGVPALTFTVVSPSQITAVVGAGATGVVKVITNTGKDSLDGFTFINPPHISSFTPAASVAGTTVTITGTDFTGLSTVSFGGVPAQSFSLISPNTITAITPSGGSGVVAVVTPGGTSAAQGYTALPVINSFTPIRGTQGAVLNISGTSLTGVTNVTVGGVNVLSYTINSSTSITAKVGPGASGSVAVIKVDGSASLPGYTWFTAPVITSFSPQSGNVGTVVTIIGTGFDATAANNSVYFGAVKATITSSSATSLTVTVPVGATFAPISVTNTSTNLSAYTNKLFLLTYPGGNLSGNTYATRTTIHPDHQPLSVSLADVDGDGKSDLLVNAVNDEGTDGELLVYRNKSTTGNAIFEDPVIYPHVGVKSAFASDIDGDGKPDIAVLSSLGVTVLRNNSTPGAISLIAMPEISAADQLNSMALGDADGDGKPDIMLSNGFALRNISIPGSIAFEKPDTVFTVSRNVLLIDINGDSKPELVYSDANNSFEVLKNISTKGRFLFEAPVSFTGFSHTYMVAGDMDADGKTDLVSADYYDNKLGVFRNTSTVAGFSFEPAYEIAIDTLPYGIAISDIDGDGKADIAVSLSNYNLAVYKNNSSTGAFSFDSPVKFIRGTFYGQHIPALGDIDGDGKNDAVINTANDEGLVSVHLNTYSLAPTIQTFSPTSGTFGDTVIISGTNLLGSNKVSFGDTSAASFRVLSATTIKAVLGEGATGKIVITSANGTTASVDTFHYLPSIVSFTPTSGIAGTVVTIKGHGFKNISSVSFGGAGADSYTTLSDTVITAVVGSGATGKVSVINTQGNAVSVDDFTFTAATAPVITSVSANTADVGATITITGNNFSSNAGSNTVYFGTIKANVLSASSNQLTVTVPAGSIYDPITVTVNYLTAISSQAFLTSFAGDHNLTNASFSEKKDIITSPVDNSWLNGPIMARDLNGDKLVDIIVANQLGGFKVLKNAGSTAGNISFAQEQLFRFTPPFGYYATGNFAIADFDGDGKPDIAQADTYNKVGVYRNTSTASAISFDSIVMMYSAGRNLTSNMHDMAVADINQDGKPDIVNIELGYGRVSVYINNSSGSTISFQDPISVDPEKVPSAMKIQDMDDDGKPDIVLFTVDGSGDSTNLYVYRNITSSPDDVSFDNGTGFKIVAPGQLLTGDIDGDSKPDIVTYNTLNQIVVMRNNSVPGTISIAAPVFYPITYSVFHSLALNDFNGDRKLDICATQSEVDSVLVLQNASTVGNIDFSKRYSYFAGKSPDAINSGDIDGDGKADIALIVHEPSGYPGQNTITILRNSSEAVAEKKVCKGDNVSLAANLTGTVYQWQQNTGSGFAHVNNNGVISGASASTLLLTAIPASYNGYQYRCVTDGTPGSVTVIRVDTAVVPTVSIATPLLNICAGATVTFTATPSSTAQSPTYQWQVNGVNAGSNSAVFSTTTLANNSQVKVIMTSTGTGNCSVTSTVSSNTIVISVNTVLPTVTISGNTTVAKDSTSTISSVISNGGASPVYQWQDSTAAHGWQDISASNASVITYKPVATGDKLRCVLTSNIACASPAKVMSNAISFTVNTVTAVNPVPAGNVGVRYYPNPVSSILTIDSLQLVDQWQTLDIIATNGSNNIVSMNVSGLTKVSVSVQNLQPGLYVVVLRRKQGVPVYLRFIKI